MNLATPVDSAAEPSAAPPEDRRGGGRAALLETGLIFVLFFLVGGWLPPDVNEAHYLGKARHYWDPSWCANDVFLESADAHLVFYWTAGWLTTLMSLPAVAWLVRLTTWLLLAVAWRRLSYAVVPRAWFAPLTAGVFLPLQSLGNMAGEWIVGGAEAKGFAYVLVLLGLSSLVRGRWAGAWLLWGAASAFHVLVGGWTVVAGLIAWSLSGENRPAFRRMLPWLLLGGLLSLPGLLPTAALNLNLPPDVVRQANWIYVHGRLSHHLVFTRFAPLLVLSHVAVALLWAAAAWANREDVAQRRLRRFVAASLLIALVGIGLSLLPRYYWSTALLRFYWFRLSDTIIPLGAALGLGGVIARWRAAGGRRARAGTALLALALVLPAVFFVLHHGFQQRDLRPPAVKQTHPLGSLSAERLRAIHEDWVRLGAWIDRHTEPDAVFVTPRLQQTFHWYARRAEVACWKNVPQDAASMVQWWARMRELYPPEVVEQGLVWHGEAQLARLARKYGARYVILDRSVSRRRLSLPRIYPTAAFPNGTFEVYRVPATSEVEGAYGEETP